MRVILRADYRTPRKEMLESLGWLSVKQLIIYNVLIFIHRMATGKGPKYLESNLLKVGECSKYQTRQSDNYLLKPYNKSSTQNSLFYKGLKIYNDFSNFVKLKSMKLGEAFKLAVGDYVRAEFPLL